MLKKERGIQARVLFIALAPVIVTAISLALYFTLLRYNDVESSLRQRGLAMSRQLAPAAQYGLFSGNNAELRRLINAVSHEPDVSAITVYDQSGKPLAATGKTLASPSPIGLANGWQGESGNGKTLSFHSKVFSSALPLDDPFSEKSKNAAQSLVLGSVTIELSRNNLLVKKREILFFTLAATALILLMAAYIARRLGRDISEPVLALDSAVRDIRDGLLTTRVRQHPAGTLRALEEGINSMAAALERVQQHSAEALTNSDTQLRQQSDFASALLEAQSSAGVCLILVEDGKIIFANQSAADFAGRTIEQLLKLSPYDVAAPSERNELDRLTRLALQRSNEYSSIEVTVVTPEEVVRHAEITAFMTLRGSTKQIVFLGVDITQKKKAATELMTAHQKLQVQKDEAERASAAKSRFLAAASHDLRQPLHALSLFSDQLQEQIKTPSQSLLANQIHAAIDNMSELLESLLNISKLDLATLQPELQATKLWPLLTQIAEAHRHAAESKQLRLIVAPTSLWISSDSRFLSRIIANLISNAVRYTHRGGIVIGARRSGDKVRIEVWDSGIGIAPEHVPFLFHEFYQVANPERDASKGLGLGLAIVERVAIILDCEIGVRSLPGSGSVFTVLIPQASAQDANPNLPAPEKRDVNILLAMTNNHERNELTLLMEKWGYAVSSCLPAEVAFLQNIHLHDLIICDAGCSAKIDQILQAQEAGSVPVIVFAPDSKANNNQPSSHNFTLLELPVKPARLRALILHLMTQNN